MAVTFMNVSHKNAKINEFSVFQVNFSVLQGYYLEQVLEDLRFPCVCNIQMKIFQKSHNFIFLACRVSVLLKII